MKGGREHQLPCSVFQALCFLPGAAHQMLCAGSPTLNRQRKLSRLFAAFISSFYESIVNKRQKLESGVEQG